MNVRFAGALAFIGFFLTPCVMGLQTVTGQSTSGASATQTTKATARASAPITGIVLTSDGQPAADVTVVLIRVGGNRNDPLLTMTGDGGAFRFDNVASGVYRALTVGITEPEFKICRPGDSLELRIWQGKGGVITGRVTDAKGEVAVEAPVRAIRVRDAEGRPLRNMEGLYRKEAYQRWTDDRGIYRLWGLPPGSYVVAAGGKDDYTRQHPGPYDDQLSTYHPASPLSGAREVVVQEWGERAGVDIAMRPLSGYSISGVVSGSLDRSLGGGARVVLSQASTGTILGTTTITNLQQRGEFRLDALSEGEYDLQAFAGSGSSITAASSVTRVNVKTSDVRGLDLKLKQLGSISIKVALEAAPVPDSCEKLETPSLSETLVTAHVDGKPQAGAGRNVFQFSWGIGQDISVAPQADGHVRLAPIEAGRYRLDVDPPNDHYYVQSITRAAPRVPAQRVDVAREGVSVLEGEHISDVTVKLAPGAAMLSGKVAPDRGAAIPVSALTVFLAPAEPESRDDVLRFAQSNVNAAGEFTFRRVKPGIYYLVVRPASEQTDTNPVWWDAKGRTQLLDQAQAGGSRFQSSENRIELGPCARVQHVLRYDNK
jgi:hypothetical protein